MSPNGRAGQTAPGDGITLRGQPLLLAAGDEVVDKDAEPAVGGGLELAHHCHHVVEPVHRFDHGAQLAQVVAPHMLDQLRVVLALHPDSAGRGEARR